MERRAWVEIVRSKLRPPLAVALGAPGEVAEFLADLAFNEAVCYQMDLYQADRLRAELGQRGLSARVVASADLWDLPADFQTVLYPTPFGGERELKIDMVEQAFHVLRPHASLIVSSAYHKDQLFPGLLKKVFGAVHTTAAGRGTIFWCRREGERSRRRHEVTFQVRGGEGRSLRFLSRPGVFSYGRFDEGARALVETMRIDPGDQIVDVGCGCGTNGTIAGRRSGLNGRVVFVDSNLRAVALAEHNAHLNGVSNFQVFGSSLETDLTEAPFDVALANPPYYAGGAIAQLFIDRSLQVLRPGGRFYLVTKKAKQIGALVAASFGRSDIVERRGYAVLCATAPARSTELATGWRTTIWQI